VAGIVPILLPERFFRPFLPQAGRFLPEEEDIFTVVGEINPGLSTLGPPEANFPAGETTKQTFLHGGKELLLPRASLTVKKLIFLPLKCAD
jgi:hypothetical protein